MKKIHVAFCADVNYFPYLGVVLKSIVNCSSREFEYVIYVVHDGVDCLSEGMLRSEIKSAQNFSLKMIDVRECEHLLSGVYVSRYITTAAYWRILLPLLLPGVEKVLYLDVDTVVLDDAAAFFTSPMFAAFVSTSPFGSSNLI